MKTIGLDLRLFGTSHGGIGRYLEQVFPRIIKLDANSSYYVFFDPNSADIKEINKLANFNNVKMVPAPIRHYSFWEQTYFLHLVNKQNLDLVHFPNFNVPVLYNKPFIVTIHDMVHHKISGAKKSRFLHFLAYKKIISSAAKKSKKIITVSDSSKKDIISFLGTDSEKIKVIYEGASLNPNVIQEHVAEIKKRYMLTKPFFLFVGVLERKKNLVNLTRGFDIFLQKYKVNMDLVVVGKTDSHYPEIRHKALDIKNPNHLVFTGKVEDWELAALYKSAYAFVNSSLHEGFGLPGLEALSFGLPLAVSNVEVFNEIYDNAALYFNPLDPEDIAEKLNLLVRDSQFYEQLQQRSFERSLLFDWDKTARETLGVYNLV